MTNTIEAPYADKSAIPHYLSKTLLSTWTQAEPDDSVTAGHQVHLGAAGTRYRFQCKLAGQDGPCEHVMKPHPQGWFKRPKFVVVPDAVLITTDTEAQKSHQFLQAFHDWMLQNAWHTEQALYQQTDCIHPSTWVTTFMYFCFQCMLYWFHYFRFRPKLLLSNADVLTHALSCQLLTSSDQVISLDGFATSVYRGVSEGVDEFFRQRPRVSTYLRSKIHFYTSDLLREACTSCIPVTAVAQQHIMLIMED